MRINSKLSLLSIKPLTAGASLTGSFSNSSALTSSGSPSLSSKTSSSSEVSTLLVSVSSAACYFATSSEASEA